MKIFASFILIILFVPVFLILLLAITLKFELLSPTFWQDTFGKHDVYSSLAMSLKSNAENQTIEHGGNKNEAKVLTDLITPLNVKDFVDKNLINILGYANNTKKDLFVYIPYRIIPKNLLPTDITENPEELPIGSFLTKFNVNFVSLNQINQIAKVGPFVTYSLVLSLAFLALFTFLMILLTESGGRFIGLMFAFVLSGLSAISLANLIGNFDIGLQPMVSIVTTPLFYELTRFWIYIGVALAVFGIVVVFVRKPQK